MGGDARQDDDPLRDELAALRAEVAALRRFRDLVEQLPDGVSVVCDGKFVYANRSCALGLGFESPAELIGKRLLDLVHPDERDEVVERVRALREGAGPLPPVERRFLRRDGGELRAEVIPLPIEFDGKPASLAIARDVTERRELQESLLQADRLASVGILAAGVAHEINNPLAYILANLEFAAAELPGLLGLSGPPSVGGPIYELMSALTDAQRGAARVRDIVRELMAFARAEDAPRAAVDVRRVLRSTLSLLGHELGQRARLVADLAEVPRVVASEARLGQVFLNVVMNAVYAVGEAGGEGHEIAVRAFAAGDGVCVEVKDSGPGIPADVLPRVFDPFFTTKPIGQGTGLGLAVSRAVVTGLGGRIQIDSAPGRGTLVRIELPAAPASAFTGTTVAAPGRAGLARHWRILVIDDDPGVVAALRRELMAEHEVTVATGGREAQALLCAGDFDMVLCDLLMPELSGMELYEAVRRARPRMAGRFVFMTGGAHVPSAAEFLAEHPVHLLKPFEMSDLHDLVRRLPSVE